MALSGVLADQEGFVETGLASYYGQKFHGRRTSNQEVYDMYAFTAAHKSLPLPSFARVTNLDTGQSVVVRVNDRGPFHEGRVVDLSYAAAVKIGVHPRGTARVEVRMDSRLVVEQMSGNWKIKHADMRRLALEARDILPAGQVRYTWIPRAENSAADALANAAMDEQSRIVRDYPGEDGAAQVAGAGRPAQDPADVADDGGGEVAGPAHPAPSSPAHPAPSSPDDAGEWGEAPIPDVDTNAPSLADPEAITLVLVSPGVAPQHRGGDPELTEEGIDLAGAAAELPLTREDERWFGPGVPVLAEQLVAGGVLRRRPTGWYWARPMSERWACSGPTPG